MSKSLRDKANHFAHNLKTDNKFSGKENKQKYNKEDIPNDVKDLIAFNTSYRYGNKRKVEAQMKADERKVRRSKDKQELRNDLKTSD